MADDTWKTSIQTSLWLTQQSSMLPTVALNTQTADQFSKKRLPPPSPCAENLSSPKRRRSDHVSTTIAERHVRQNKSLQISADYMAPYLCRPLKHSISCSPERANDDYESTTTSAPNISAPVTTVEEKCSKCALFAGQLDESVDNISKLAVSFTSGVWSEVLAQWHGEGFPHEQIPHVVDAHRIFDTLSDASRLAKQVESLASSLLRVRSGTMPGTSFLDPSIRDIKQRDSMSSQNTIRKPQFGPLRNSRYHRNAAADTSYAVASEMITPEDTMTSGRLAPIRGANLFNPPPDGTGTRLPPFNQASTSKRLSPTTPPSKSRHQSPQPHNIPSPPSFAYSHSAPAPPHSTPSITNHPLSPITTSFGEGPSPAIQAHTAALQHEVSVQKFALSTLQSEHDKLLAALSRSKTRARALEEKQVASDIELNTLAEERVRLSTQISELEDTLNDTRKSKEDHRAAAVREGKQYLEMVMMASRLEERASSERRQLARRFLANKQGNGVPVLRHEGEHIWDDKRADVILNTSAAQTDERKLQRLETEIQDLRSHCRDLEGALRDIKDGSQHIDDMTTILSSSTQKVLARADCALAAGISQRPGSAVNGRS
ncbi:MAG: hypothetical protein M1818_004724 [Claussenomyces sp. TS43310]|nr:MAG: hypothetical protein M1818_004724 [Claussenomyces sp. TS43310]